MNILIKGMVMPKQGRVTLQIGADGAVYVVDKCEITAEKYEKNFEVLEVPPHGRLGDLDRLEQMFVDIDNAPYSGFDGTEPFYSAEDAAQIIRLAPTVIPADKDGEE